MGAKKYAFVNYKMLVWARSETPFGTTSDVVNHISGFRSEVIDKWERGEELPSITEAKKLANLYKVPFATFYLSNPPEKKTKAYWLCLDSCVLKEEPLFHRILTL